MMRKKMTVLLLTCVLGMEFMGCAKTPDKAVVADKSKGLAEENIIPEDQDTPKDLKVPEHWKETIEKSDGYVTIDADLDLQIPEVYNTPVSSYEIKPMTNKLLDKLCDYLGDGKKLYAETEMTKEELNAEKEKMERADATWGYDDSRTLKEEINSLDQIIQSAPDKASEKNYIKAELTVPTQLDKEKVTGSHDGRWFSWYYDTKERIGFTGRIDTGGVCDPLIRATTYNEKVGSASAFSYTHGIFRDEVQLKDDIDSSHILTRQDDSYEKYLQFLNTSMEQAEDETFTEEDALKQVEQILKDLNIEGLAVNNCVKAIGNIDSNSWAGLEDGVTPKDVGYSVYLTPKTGDTTAFTMPRSLQMNGLPETEYAPKFLPEELNIIVTKDGIQRFQWIYLSKKIDTIAKNTKILTFDEIKEKFEEHLVYYTVSMDGETGKADGYKTHFQVKNVQLRAATINAFDQPDQAWLVPVWVFTVEYASTLPTGEPFIEYTVDFMFNAIDGGYATVPMG